MRNLNDEGRNTSQQEQNLDLEFLIQYGVYHGFFNGLGKTRHNFPNSPDPHIIIKKGNKDYFGYITKSDYKNQDMRNRSNEIREEIIEKKKDMEEIRVKVIRFSKDGNTRGPYKLIATDEELKEEVNGHFSANKAFSVVKGGTNIFYGQSRGKEGKKRTSSLRVYVPDALRKVGYLSSKINYENGLYMGKIFPEREDITEELDNSLNFEDCTLVRKISWNREHKLYFFEALINFTEDDKALSGQNEQLVTRVEGCEPRDRIFDLPIIKSMNGDEAEPAGKGYVVQSRNESDSICYKPVKIIGADEDAGKYVREARIIENGPELILAEKL